MYDVLLEAKELQDAHLGDHVELVEVEAGAERAVAGTGEDQRAQSGVAQGSGCEAVLVEHPHRLRVHPVRPIDTQYADVVDRLEGERLQFGKVHGHRPVKTAGRFSLNAFRASGMSALLVSSACPRFSSSSAAA